MVLLSGREFEILSAYHQTGVKKEGFKEIVKKNNEFNLKTIAQEFILIKKTQAAFPNDPLKLAAINRSLKNCEYYIKKLEKEELNKEIQKHRKKVNKFTLDIGPILHDTGNLNYYYDKLISFKVERKNLFYSRNRINNVIREIWYNNQNLFEKKIFEYIKNYISKYEEWYHVSREEYETLNISSSDDYDYALLPRAIVEDILYALNKIFYDKYNKFWMNDEIEHMYEIDKKYEEIMPTIVEYWYRNQDTRFYYIPNKYLINVDLFWNRIEYEISINFNPENIEPELR